MLLFAVSLAGILLAIAVGVASIAEREIRFGTSAKDTGSAFLAADTGVECAISHDKSLVSAFPIEGLETSVTCANLIAPLTWVETNNGGVYYFTLTGLGSGQDGCAQVSVEKDNVSDPAATRTIIVSKGYNLGDADCEFLSASRVERELEVSYDIGNPPAGPPPAAGFPLVKGTAASTSPKSTSHEVALPSSIEEGDLLIVFFSVNDIAAIPQWPEGWQQLFKVAHGDTFEARFKIADGTENETGTITVSTAPKSERSAHQSFRIVNFSGTPEATPATGSSTTPDPPTHTTSWSSAKTLWIAAVGRVSGKDITTDFPANYSNHRSQQTGSADAGTTVDTAVRILETASENPGAFSVPDGGSKKWIAATVAIPGEASP